MSGRSQTQSLLPPAAPDCAALRPLTKSEEQERIIINRPGRSTYPEGKSVLTSGATPFHLRPTVDNQEKIQLEWTEAGHDVPFTASALSDGTLRFICLSTVLLQPEEFMPAAMLIDEPELGLHPYAVAVLAALMRSAADKHQLIISTQSVELVNEFDPEDLIVVNKASGASTFNRANRESLSEWLREYSLGEIWKKNLLGGRPSK